jgi:hypothetical protein
MREKLFFLEHIDLDNKIIIDFGAANGALAKEIIKTNPINTTYFCVENNEEFFKECEKLKDTGVLTVSGLTEVEMWLRHNKEHGQDDREVVLICSSVLHECTPKMQKSIVGFSRSWCKYMIVRDMCFGGYFDEEEKLSLLEHIIVFAKHPELMQQFFYMRGISDESIAEYLLKYSYVENWASEVHEKYLGVDWTWIKLFRTPEVEPHILFENIYTNNFIASKVYQDFGIEITWPTHCQLIVEMK